MNAVVAARELTKTYGEGALAIRVLHGVSLLIPHGQLVLLMGPSGSGKTTLVSILAGLMRPTSGSVDLCGASVGAAPERQVARVRRDGVGFVFQSYNLFPALTAIENVASALVLRGERRSVAHARARAVLAQVGLADRAGHRPSELSGGQKQRVAIARAFVGAPSVIIGDEVTAALDGESAHSIMQLLRNYITLQSAALLVTHDRRLERYADRIIEMEDGRIVRDSLLSGGVAKGGS